MSWHGTKGFPGGREIKLDPGLESSTAIYASLNLLSSTSTTRRRHPPRFTLSVAHRNHLPSDVPARSQPHGGLLEASFLTFVSK